MRSYKTEAIIIKRRNYGEADRVLTVLTKTYGKIQVRAPGVRRITSRRSSHIELLNLSVLTLYRSFRASMPIVTEAQAQEEFLSIKNTLKKIGFAYYICELIDSLCAEGQENRRVFFIARDTLFRLSNYSLGNPHPNPLPMGEGGGEGGEPLSIIDDFEDDLLVILGFLPKYHGLTDKRTFIESILEKKLRTKQALYYF